MNCCTCHREIFQYAADCGENIDQWAAHWDGRVWCGPCLRTEHAARKSARKIDLETARCWELTETIKAMDSAGLKIGDRVSYWCQSYMGGLAGYSVEGVLVVRAGRVRVDCGRKVATSKGAARFVPWNLGWIKVDTTTATAAKVRESVKELFR